MNTYEYIEFTLDVEDLLSQHSLYMDDNTQYSKYISGRKKSGAHF